VISARDAFRVSRNTVGEASRALGQEGLVHNTPRPSVVANAISIDDVLDIFRVRQLVELRPSPLVFATPSGSSRSRRPSHASVRLLARDMNVVAEADAHFHRALVRLIESPRLKRCTRRSAWRCSCAYRSWKSSMTGPGLVDEYEELFMLLQAGDRRRAGIQLEAISRTASSSSSALSVGARSRKRRRMRLAPS
jgi:DNA-binding GntR family transcriptional regulator